MKMAQRKTKAVATKKVSKSPKAEKGAATVKQPADLKNFRRDNLILVLEDILVRLAALESKVK